MGRQLRKDENFQALGREPTADECQVSAGDCRRSGDVAVHQR
jgi:hypothetical protein